MTDDKKPIEPASDEDQNTPTQPTPPQPYTRRPESDEPPETISLLDLMQESGDDGDTTPTTPPEPTELPPLTSPTTRPKTNVTPPPDDYTATITSIPEPRSPLEEDTTKKPPQPLTAEQLQPPEAIPPQFDPDATVVQPRVAFPGSQQTTQKAGSGQSQTQQGTTVPAQRPPQRAPVTTQPAARPAGPIRETPRGAQAPPTITRPAPSTGRGCARIFAVLLVGLIVLTLLAASTAAIGYSLVARDLPNPAELRERASDFETARIYDRTGQLLYAPADPNAGNRIYVPLDQISPYLIQATIATEDKRFYENPGFDPIGLTRAVIQAVLDQEEIGGTSTITQQLVRALLLDEDERTERTVRRKIREIILAAEISRTYSKDEILELYLNEIYYGNLAYGIEAASQTYFQTSAANLSLSEASLLAGLPQAPALWDPYTAPDKAIGRQSEVLGLMVSNGDITLDEGQAALDEMAARIYDLEPPQATILHPHFTLTVLQQAEALLGAQSIYRGGLSIQTTLDPTAQNLAEETIAAARPSINAGGANNAAMVVIQPETGEILGMVGSVDYYDESISGQVNMALAPRQPGSTIKPLVYMSAFEEGWTPATLIWDVPTEFPDGANPPYVPKNYDDTFHGPLRLRPSLGNSYNVPAVKALEYVGRLSSITSRRLIDQLRDDGC
ncbi:MAG: transglycosylase domain-containing protein [Chloroflexota bacterium]